MSEIDKDLNYLFNIFDQNPPDRSKEESTTEDLLEDTKDLLAGDEPVFIPKPAPIVFPIIEDDEAIRLQKLSKPLLDKDIAPLDEELHAYFYNDEAILVSNMDAFQLRNHISKLQRICFEGRARLLKADAEDRERTAKLSKEDRDKLITNPNFKASERSKLKADGSARPTKADKLKAGLDKLGLSDELIATMMRNIKGKNIVE